MKHLGYIFLVFILPKIAFTIDSGDEIEYILRRHQVFLLKEASGSENIKQLLNSFDKDKNQWNYIDYQDAQKSDWKISEHLENVKMLALAWNDKRTEWYRNHVVYDIIVRALDNWSYNQYKNPNWWHNEIGVPQLMRDILVLMNDELPLEKMDGYLEILKQHKIDGKGANLIWSADLALYYGLLVNDVALIDSAVAILVAEIEISEGEGLKPDFSFQQHGARLQMYQYGASFLLNNIRIAWELQESRWAYPADKLELLTSMLLNGWQWMARGVYTVPNTMDRSATRPNELNKADVRLYIGLFKDLMPAKSRELNRLNEIQAGNGSGLSGFKYFPYSDFVAYHRPDFSFFLKTISSRTLPSESINHENLKGKLMNSGETYFVRDGNEYFNMMPVWDWDKLPGLTGFSGADIVERKDFTGSVSDGSVGLSSMDYAVKSKNGDRRVSAKKTWIAYGNYMLCLISDMTMENLNMAYTILDQSRMRDLITSDKGSIEITTQEQQMVKWVRHHDFLYFRPGDADSLFMYADTVHGNWYSINRGYSTEPIMERVFMPFIEHHPHERAYAYVVASASDIKTKEAIAKQPFSIITNNEKSQSVMINDGSVAATFYQPGEIYFKGAKISVDRPCQLLIRRNRLYVSDPTHQGGSLTVKYDSKYYQIDFLSNGTTTSIDL